ncbi:hypothetical protein AciX9_4355 (plasmid) [Granulicella tundricola MP5ACTX9]|uniref:Response regulator receiver protein n=1 Tax=Granulicella tundricola (strain ATCC BAA-1859 / DSM 23138 / MP5ACTX9) TaxID=1198114 RepID=E8X773_GRATM|nr:hypothetical protein AciX9_4355 [Granulicella tundricola MP5ACTX9]
MLDVSRPYPADTPITGISRLQAQRDESREESSLILVEPDLSFLPDRALMLTEASYRVTTVRDIRELASLCSPRLFGIALLSELLGPAALDFAARFVRTEWPGARILFLGASQRVLEDHLYDERIEASCKPHELLKAIGTLHRTRSTARPFIVPALAANTTLEPKVSSSKQQS